MSGDCEPIVESAMDVYDWVHLPTGLEAQALWGMHDAELISIHSNADRREVTMIFEAPHLMRFHGFPEDLQFIFRFTGVSSVRAVRGRPNELNPAIRTYLEESVSWRSLECSMTRENEQYIDVNYAEFVSNHIDKIAFRLEGYFNHADRHELIIRGKKLDVMRSDRKATSIEYLHDLGKLFWKSWKEKHSAGNATHPE